MSVQLIEINEDQDGQRIDNFLFRHFRQVPKSHVYRLLRTGQVRVNKGRVRANYRLRAGDQVRLPPVQQAERSATTRTIPDYWTNRLREQVLLENEHLLVLNKPAGLAVHAGSQVAYGLIDVVRALYPQLSFLELVHRLDRETSGCLLLAKDRPTLMHLHEQIRENRMVKKYLLAVKGPWNTGKRTVEAPLKKDTLQGGERMVRVDPEGKPACTHFRLLQAYPPIALLEAEIETGRTHQIRVHAAHIGHPVVGDDKYGDRELNRWAREQGLERIFLHAHWLEFSLPGETRKRQVHAPLGEDLQEFLNRLEHETEI